MRIAVDPAAAKAELLDQDVFTAFDVSVPAGATVPAVAEALGGVGSLEGAEIASAHVRVSIRWLRESAHAAGADVAWEEQFAGMLAYATSKGWVEGDTVRAHVVEV